MSQAAAHREGIRQSAGGRSHRWNWCSGSEVMAGRGDQLEARLQGRGTAVKSEDLLRLAGASWSTRSDTSDPGEHCFASSTVRVASAAAHCLSAI